MLKKSILFLLLSVVTLCVSAQDGWYKQKINDNVSVNFPAEVKKLNEQSYGFKDKNGVVFVVSSVDLLKITDQDLATFNTNLETKLWMDEFVEGIAQSMKKFKFMSANKVKVKGFTAYDLKAINEEAQTNLFMKVVFVNGTSHSLTCLVPDANKITPEIEKFLAGEIYVTK
ncbi:MAG: hypothetical protein EOP00_05155 [Pedobacter sp.]|nr:MAG: hypothetical protein EOP00_05155 [Pedobacter sp.]